MLVAKKQKTTKKTMEKENQPIITIDGSRNNKGKLEIFIQSSVDFTNLRDPVESRPSITLGGTKVHKSRKEGGAKYVFNVGDNNDNDVLLVNQDEEEKINLSFLLHPNLKEGVKFEFPNLLLDKSRVQRFCVGFKEQAIKLYCNLVKPIRFHIEIREIRVG